MRKRNLSTRLLSILVCVCMVLCFLPAVAFAADMTGGEVLYLKPNSEWASANARFAIYVYGSGEAWESMVPVEGADGIYQVTVPSGNWTNVIFCRMNPATTDNNWNNKWNQSGDLVYDGVNNLCTIKNGQWDCGMNVTWSVYSKEACPHENHDVDGKCTACGEPVEHNYVGGSCVCGAENPDAFKVYFINSAMWAEVSAHAWIEGVGGTTWPGEAMTRTEETVNDFDVYEIIFDVAYENVIFNNTQGIQTDNLEMMPNQYFNMEDGTWYESLDDVPAVDPLATDTFLVGSFNEWSTTANEFKRNAEGDAIAYVSLELEAETKYDFKIVRGGAWTSCDTAITGDISDLVFSGDVSGNCSITTTAADTYVFAYDLGSNTLSVVYPEVEEPACTHENHDVDGKCTACGEPVEHIYVDGVCACGFKNGIVAENDGLYYYVDGKLNYAGLIEIDGDMYYVRCNGELVRGKTYWTTKTNGLKDYAGYYFDEDGKLHERNGLIEENGGLYYYVNSKLYYAGLIEIDGNLYYIRSNGQAVTGRTYWTTKTNGLKEYAGYYFDETGKLCE